jgi:hypothetical protein
MAQRDAETTDIPQTGSAQADGIRPKDAAPKAGTDSETAPASDGERAPADDDDARWEQRRRRDLALRAWL